jgi:PAS domain S-box-containing protein
MAIIPVLLLQVLIYSLFPFYFVTLPYHLRSIAFYIYLSVLYVFGGFLGSVYSFRITEGIMISGGNLNYGAFMMTIILLVIIESDLDIVRHVIRVIITVNAFKLLLYSSLSWALTTTSVMNPFQTSASVFDVSIPFVILGGSLIVLELLAFLFIFSQAKRWIDNILVLALLYSIFYLLILVVDGILFPLFSFATNPPLVDIIYGNVSGKIFMGMIYSVPMLLFILMNRQHFVAFVKKELDFSDLFKISRRALQVALQDSERRYRLLVDSSPYAIAIYQDEKIVFVNEAARRLIGVDDDKALLGQPFLAIVPSEQRNQSQELFQKILLSEGENSKTIEQEILSVDGRQIPVELSAVLISYQGHIAIQIIAKDISERKAAEQASQEATRLQIELDKERELRELKLRFTSMIVHDLRNPMTAISNSAELILRYADIRDFEKIKDRAARIRSTSKQTNNLIDDLLELGRTESSLMNIALLPHDIVPFCRQVFTSFEQTKGTTQHNYEFLTSIESQILYMDTKLMERALENLLSNAVKYSPNGDKVQMKISRLGDSVLIAVSDNGIGIPKEELERIFEIFHRAANASEIEGTGIGLAITKQIVEGHAGTITCQSEPGQGTTFTISLPIKPLT